MLLWFFWDPDYNSISNILRAGKLCLIQIQHWKLRERCKAYDGLKGPAPDGIQYQTQDWRTMLISEGIKETFFHAQNIFITTPKKPGIVQVLGKSEHLYVDSLPCLPVT